MERALEKLYWLIRLFGSLEYSLSDLDKEKFEAGEDVTYEPDWQRIQQYLMPDVFLLLGFVVEAKIRRYYPAAVIVPSLGDYWRVTTDEDLDVLKAELDIIVPESQDRASLRELTQRVVRIPEKNAKQKGLRLLAELSKLLSVDV